MTKRIKYTVHCPAGEVAKFSSYSRAMDFAAQVSSAGHLVEVSMKDGLVGQYANGDTTPEFKSYHDNRAA